MYSQGSLVQWILPLSQAAEGAMDMPWNPFAAWWDPHSEKDDVSGLFCIYIQ